MRTLTASLARIAFASSLVPGIDDRASTRPIGLLDTPPEVTHDPSNRPNLLDFEDLLGPESIFFRIR